MAMANGQQRSQTLQALLDAREALKGAAGSGRIHVAGVLQNGRRGNAQHLEDPRLSSALVRSSSNKTETSFRTRIIRRSSRRKITASHRLSTCWSGPSRAALTAGRRGGSRQKPRAFSCARSSRSSKGRMDIRGILGVDSDVRKRLRRHQGDVHDRRGCVEEGTSKAPRRTSRRSARRCTTWITNPRETSPSKWSSHRTLHHGRRRRPGHAGSGGEPNV